MGTNIKHKILGEECCALAPCVELAARDEVGNLHGGLFETLEKQVLAVDAMRLGRYGEDDDLNAGELRDDTAANGVSTIVHTISSIFLVDIKNFIELCNEVLRRAKRQSRAVYTRYCA